MCHPRRGAVPAVPVRVGRVTAGRHVDRNRGRDGVHGSHAGSDRRSEVSQPPSARLPPCRAAEPPARSHADRCHHVGADERAAGPPPRVRPGRAAGPSAGSAVAQAVPADVVPAPWAGPDRTVARSTTARTTVLGAPSTPPAARARDRRCRHHRCDAARRPRGVARRRRAVRGPRRRRGNPDGVTPRRLDYTKAARRSTVAMASELSSSTTTPNMPRLVAASTFEGRSSKNAVRSAAALSLVKAS